MSWQDQVRGEVGEFGLTVTSGYRDTATQRRIGSPLSSYHHQGTASAPGAIDVGGSAKALTAFFFQILHDFPGRINELFLNLANGRYLAVKHNKELGYNPEAGRPQHLHIALSGEAPGGSLSRQVPAMNIPEANRGNRAQQDVSAATGECSKKLCLPTIPHVLDPPPCVCFSDVIAYSVGVGIVLLGALLLFRGAGGR